MFSPDGTLISASAAPHCRAKKKTKKKKTKKKKEGKEGWSEEKDGPEKSWF